MAYYKPQSPLKKGEDFVYPLTTYDQIIMADGNRWDGKAEADSTELRMLISQRAMTANYSAIFLANGWSAEAPYEQTVAVEGMLATDVPIVDIDMSGAATSEDGTALGEVWNLVGRVTAIDGAVTAFCYTEKPTVNVPVVLKVVR